MIEPTVDAVTLHPSPTIAPDTSVSEAAQSLRRTDVAALSVVADESTVGIVTESDIVALVAETDERPPVRTIMSSPVTTISSAATLAEAAATMRTSGVKHLPVVDDDSYRGLLSARTLAPYLPRYRLEIEWHDDPLCLDSSDGDSLTAGD